MAKSHNDRNHGRVLRRRRTLGLLVALAAGVGLLGFAYAQSANTLSLNSPVSFPVDI